MNQSMNQLVNQSINQIVAESNRQVGEYQIYWRSILILIQLHVQTKKLELYTYDPNGDVRQMFMNYEHIPNRFICDYEALVYRASIKE